MFCVCMHVSIHTQRHTEIYGRENTFASFIDNLGSFSAYLSRGTQHDFLSAASVGLLDVNEQAVFLNNKLKTNAFMIEVFLFFNPTLNEHLR